ncbi:MAG: GNAT family N-acetyltransferase [Bryobacteraceae bacterium]|nr:GNAT family N-acetyltransferase [Bryobacteraceae bacterium]
MHHRVVEENLRTAMRCYGRVSAVGESRDYPGIVVTYCGLPSAVFNSALLNAPADEDEFRRALALATVHFRQRGVGWTLWLCEDLLNGMSLRRHVALMMKDNGMDSIAFPPGMYAEKLATPAHPLPELRVRRVSDAATRLDFAHLSSNIFALPFQTAQQVYANEALWAPPMYGWVGYRDGLAVTLACVVIGGGAAGVYSVGTLPAFQRRGYAETIVRHALDESRADAGTDATVLQSTAQGLKLYTRMGYRPVTKFGVYMYENWRRN